MSMKTKDTGFGIQDSGKELVPERLSTARLSTLGFGLSKLKEQTGNVDENKGQGQKVEESSVWCQESEVRPTTEG
jgi:hypothetical protein